MKQTKRTVKSTWALLLALLMALSAMFAMSCKSSEFDNTKNISVVAREDGSGTKSAFMELLGLKGKKDVSGVVVASGTAAALAEVRSNPLAIAYDSLGYVTSDVKKLKVDGVEATVENIKNGTYKISRPLQVVYQPEKENDALCTAYLAFLKSDTAQSMIKDQGYIALIDNAEKYTVNAELSGTINISGSTSLQPLMLELAKKFHTLQPNVEVIVQGGGSGVGYTNASNKVSDFGMISEVFHEEKAPGCKVYEVAKDGIAIIVNPKNPIENISLATLKNIYNVDAGDAAVKTWADAEK